MHESRITAGIIGGIGPESTIDYYRLIVAGYRERKRDGSYPSIVINSVDLQKVLAHIGAGELTEVTDYLVAELHKLARASADFGVLASNTPHRVFDALQRLSPIPLISIVEVTRDAAIKLKLKRLGLLGTSFTMQAGFYPDVMRKAGIAVVAPAPHEQDYVHDIYMNELLNSDFRPESRAGSRRDSLAERPFAGAATGCPVKTTPIDPANGSFDDRVFSGRRGILEIVGRLKAEEGIDGVILGGTELPLLLRDIGDQGVPFLDTTKLHVEQVVARLLQD